MRPSPFPRRPRASGDFVPSSLLASAGQKRRFRRQPSGLRLARPPLPAPPSPVNDESLVGLELQPVRRGWAFGSRKSLRVHLPRVTPCSCEETVIIATAARQASSLGHDGTSELEGIATERAPFPTSKPPSVVRAPPRPRLAPTAVRSRAFRNRSRGPEEHHITWCCSVSRLVQYVSWIHVMLIQAYGQTPPREVILSRTLTSPRRLSPGASMTITCPRFWHRHPRGSEAPSVRPPLRTDVCS